MTTAFGTGHSGHSRSSGPVLSRRRLLGLGAAGALGALGGSPAAAGAASPRSRTRLAASSIRQAGSLPNPSAPIGSDQLPQVEHIVVVMMENHSFDNMLGMLGRGDGLPRGRNGAPKVALPTGHGQLIHSFHMPSVCQGNGVSNDWDAGHRSYDNGTNLGFASAEGGETMGYFLGSDLPGLWGVARTFPIADRWFCSVMAQTYPNRRYLISGTSLGLIDDTFPPGLPPNGTIFDSFNTHGITWKDYSSDLPTTGVYLELLSKKSIASHVVPIGQFYEDAAGGHLPQFSLLEPNYSLQSQESPEDVQFGDQFFSDVVNTVLHSPNWSKTLMIWTYDEWGGYYDHVPPSAAVPPDDIPPNLPPGSEPGTFGLYGFRVPSGVISPYAKRNYVSHTVYDHTSVLKTVERKWNLPALTRRDANAADVLDMVDFRSPPSFSHPATIQGANPVNRWTCLLTGPGRIPPASAVTLQ